MKTTLLFALQLILLRACTTIEDDFISKYCPGSCTVIEGRLTTDDGSKPLAGVKVKIDYFNRDALGISAITRSKAVTQTDQNGYYKLSFLLRDDEIPGAGHRGGDFFVYASINTDTYLTCSKSQQIKFYPALKRKTNYQLNFLIPKKAYVVLEANNLSQISTNDDLRTEAFFKLGADGSPSCGGTIWWQNERNNVTDTIEVAANQQVIIKTTKRKSNTETVTETALNLKPGQYTKLQLSF